MSDRLNGFSRRALSAALVVVLVLSACAHNGQAPAPKGSAAAARPAPPPDSAMPAAAPLVSASMQAHAQKLAIGAATLLEAGHEEPARAELQKALGADPNNRLATSLMKQITADPITVLGRESFSYTVRPNDTMSGIAGRFLGDIYSFYILARYNNIAVPRQVGDGQVLRIPGKAPRGMADAPMPRAETQASAPAVAMPIAPTPPGVPAPPSPAPPPEPTAAERAMRSAQASEKAGNLEQARNEYVAAAKLDQPGASAKVDQLGKQLVQRYTLNARTAFAKQDLDGAIRGWDGVLAIDPTNETAKLERQRALTLKKKAEKLR